MQVFVAALHECLVTSLCRKLRQRHLFHWAVNVVDIDHMLASPFQRRVGGGRVFDELATLGARRQRVDVFSSDARDTLPH